MQIQQSLNLSDIFWLTYALVAMVICLVYVWETFRRNHYNPLLHPVLNEIVASLNDLQYGYIPQSASAAAALVEA